MKLKRTRISFSLLCVHKRSYQICVVISLKSCFSFAKLQISTAQYIDCNCCLISNNSIFPVSVIRWTIYCPYIYFQHCQTKNATLIKFANSTMCYNLIILISNIVRPKVWWMWFWLGWVCISRLSLWHHLSRKTLSNASIAKTLL